jgi:hypothetical protein
VQCGLTQCVTVCHCMSLTKLCCCPAVLLSWAGSCCGVELRGVPLLPVLLGGIFVSCAAVMYRSQHASHSVLLQPVSLLPRTLHRHALQVLEREDCEALGMGLYLGVAAASAEPPKFIHLTYTPQGAPTSPPLLKARAVAAGDRGVTGQQTGLAAWGAASDAVGVAVAVAKLIWPACSCAACLLSWCR